MSSKIIDEHRNNEFNLNEKHKQYNFFKMTANQIN